MLVALGDVSVLIGVTPPLDASDHLMAMTTTGSIISLRVNSRADKDELQLVEWVELREKQSVPEQKYIDAVYWLDRDIVLRLDNEGYLSAIDQTVFSPKIKRVFLI